MDALTKTALADLWNVYGFNYSCFPVIDGFKCNGGLPTEPSHG